MFKDLALPVGLFFLWASATVAAVSWLLLERAADAVLIGTVLVGGVGTIALAIWCLVRIMRWMP